MSGFDVENITKIEFGPVLIPAKEIGNFTISTMANVYVEENAEPEDAFFSSGSTSISGSEKYTFVFDLAGDGSGLVQLDQEAKEWISGLKAMPDFSAFPDEIQELIKAQFLLSSRIGKESNFIPDDTVEFLKFSQFVLDNQDLKKEAYEGFERAKNAIAMKMKAAQEASGGQNMLQFAKRYMFKKHILIKGEKGVGKTYTMDKMLNDSGIETRFIAGQEGLESIDLLGYYSKDDSGNLVWLDGVLSEVFRIAKDKPVALFYDEILRTRARELNILVGSLSPSASGTFRLRTNRIVDVKDGVGTTEIIEVPQENLWVVGTTNVGAKYNVDDIDEALGDRFRIYQKETSEQEVHAILEEVAEEKFGSAGKTLADKMMKMFNKVNSLQESGELEKAFNLRHMIEAVKACDDIKLIRSYIFDLIPNIASVDNEGRIDKGEKEILLKLIKKL